MFEKDLKEKFEKIFDMKVSFSEPGESNEQECLFIEITKASPRIKDQKEICRVEGQVSVYGNHDKLKYGYISKQISRAPSELKKHFFFYDMEENQRIFQNIVQRSFSFVYFFSGQYDPEQGIINETTISVEVNP